MGNQPSGIGIHSHYQLGKLNAKANTLFCCWDLVLGQRGTTESLPTEIKLFKLREKTMEKLKPSINSTSAQSVQRCTLKHSILEYLKAISTHNQVWPGIKMALEDKSQGIDKNLILKDGLLYYKSWWYVPDDPVLKNKLLNSCHYSKLTGHFGLHKTTEQLRALFCWPCIDKDIEEYVRRCDNCQQNKASGYKNFSLLQSLKVLYCL